MCVCKGQKGGNTVTAWWHARRAYFDAAGSFWKLEGREGNVVFKEKRFEKNLPVSNQDFLDIFVGVVSWPREVCLPREKFLCFNFGYD